MKSPLDTSKHVPLQLDATINAIVQHDALKEVIDVYDESYHDVKNIIEKEIITYMQIFNMDLNEIIDHLSISLTNVISNKMSVVAAEKSTMRQ